MKKFTLVFAAGWAGNALAHHNVPVVCLMLTIVLIYY